MNDVEFEALVREEKRWEAYCDAVDAACAADVDGPRCGTCWNFCRAVPGHFPDMDARTLEVVGWCHAIDEFVRADDLLRETECEEYV